jgi:hypothetical protein
VTHIVSESCDGRHNNPSSVGIEPALLYYQSNRVSMDSSETSADPERPIQPLQVSVELLANLIYLARRTETHSDQQHRYLDWAAKVIEELQHHPKLHE